MSTNNVQSRCLSEPVVSEGLKRRQLCQTTYCWARGGADLFHYVGAKWMHSPIIEQSEQGAVPRDMLSDL